MLLFTECYVPDVMLTTLHTVSPLLLITTMLIRYYDFTDKEEAQVIPETWQPSKGSLHPTTFLYAPRSLKFPPRGIPNAALCVGLQRALELQQLHFSLFSISSTKKAFSNLSWTKCYLLLRSSAISPVNHPVAGL